MSDLYREIAENADVMKQWMNPCVREAWVEYNNKRYSRRPEPDAGRDHGEAMPCSLPHERGGDA